jgi:hypothetical protein
VGVDVIEDGFGELMAFEQVTEMQQGGGVGCGIPGEVNADETADGLAVLDGVFDAFVGEAEALLRHIHPQHPGKSNRRTTWTTATWVERGDGMFQCSPGCDGVEFSEEAITPS